nr:hypothetical protein [Tanacetum cinerariifolium]
MQTQTSNTLHNAIMEAGSKDRPPMLAPDWQDIEVPVSKGSPITTTERIHETYKNVSQDIRDQLNAEAEAVQIILTGIDNDIYSTVDACPNACEMWKAIERLKQGESINVLQDDKRAYQKSVQSNQSSSECSVLASITPRMAKHEVNERRAKKIAHVANPLALVAQQQPTYHPQNHPTHYTQNSSTRSQQAATRNKGKAIVNSPQPIYDQESLMVAEDEEISAGYENQRIGNVAGAKENVAYHREKMLLCKQEEARIQLNAEQADWRDDTDDDELEDQELEAHYMYMAQFQEVSPDATDSGPIFDDELLEKVSTDDHYNVFSMESVHPEQSKSDHDTYPIEQDAQNMIIDSLDMNYDREEIDQNDDDNDLAKEHEVTNLQCDYLELLEKYEGLETELSKGVIPTTSVSRPQLKSNPQGDRVMHNNSQGKKQAVEDHRRSVKLSKNKTSIIACNDSLNAKTLNVKSVSAMCDKYVLNDKHDMYVLKFVAKTLKETVASKSSKKPRNFTWKLYERVSKTCSWWYPKFTPSGYKWKPKSGKENVNPNLVEIVLFIVDSGCSRHMTGNLKLLINFVEKFLGTVKFRNEQIAPILGYGDLVQEAVTIKRVYYVEGLNHNLFSIGQFRDADLEVAFRKSTCFIHDLKGNDLLTGSRGTDLYSITLEDTYCPNLIFLMAKATSSQAWLWHRRLYTWTHFLRSKDETPDVLIDFLRLVQRGLQAQVRLVRTNKGTEFLNQTLHAYFAAEGIRLQTSVARTPEQNGVVERRNPTLVEDARTMLSAAKVPLFFWAEAIATACFTQNRSLVIPRHEKTPYHIINDQKMSVKFFYIFGSICYIVRDGENLDKMKEKDKTVTMSNELDLLFSLMFVELLNGSSKVVSKSSAVSAADAPNQHQHHTTPLNIHTTPTPTCQVSTLAPTVISFENINQAETYAENDQVADDKFINIFSTPEAMADSAWIESMQEELHQFDRLDVWELVDRPLCTNVINLKWL